MHLSNEVDEFCEVPMKSLLTYISIRAIHLVDLKGKKNEKFPLLFFTFEFTSYVLHILFTYQSDMTLK
jgi:hypothetical protein